MKRSAGGGRPGGGSPVRRAGGRGSGRPRRSSTVTRLKRFHDVLFFLTYRTKFICYLYETAGEPFRERIRKIEANEEPFYSPLNRDSEGGEPAFLVEWTEAREGLNVLGRVCISMLSASLQLYFRTWKHELGFTWEEDKRKGVFKNGFLQGYKTYFGEVQGLSWDDCPADLGLLEQVVLARHRDQHPDDISTMGVRHTPKDREKFPQLFFASEIEKLLYADLGLTPPVYVAPEMLFAAIKEVNTLAQWLEERVLAVRYRR